MASPDGCRVVTELMPTWRNLWTQRLRWQRGALENLGAYGPAPTVLRYWAQQLGSEIPFWAVSPLEVTALGAPAEAASLGHGHTCALTAGGLLWCWGWNEYGQLGDGTVLESVWPLLVQTPACP